MENMLALTLLTCGLFVVAGAIFAAQRVRQRQYERVSKRKKQSPKHKKKKKAPKIVTPIRRSSLEGSTEGYPLEWADELESGGDEDEILLATIDVSDASDLGLERSTETPSPSHLRNEVV